MTKDKSAYRPQLRRNPNGLPGIRPTAQALLVVLQERGGEMKSSVAPQIVAAKFPAMTSKARSRVMPSGARAWDKQVAWARLLLVHQGFIVRGGTKGVWELTSAGKRAVQLDVQYFRTLASGRPA
jgi:hypothetical protein